MTLRRRFRRLRRLESRLFRPSLHVFSSSQRVCPFSCAPPWGKRSNGNRTHGMLDRHAGRGRLRVHAGSLGSVAKQLTRSSILASPRIIRTRRQSPGCRRLHPLAARYRNNSPRSAALPWGNMSQAPNTGLGQRWRRLRRGRRRLGQRRWESRQHGARSPSRHRYPRTLRYGERAARTVRTRGGPCRRVPLPQRACTPIEQARGHDGMSAIIASRRPHRAGHPCFRRTGSRRRRSRGSLPRCRRSRPAPPWNPWRSATEVPLPQMERPRCRCS